MTSDDSTGSITWHDGAAHVELRGPTSLGTRHLRLHPGVLDGPALEYLGRRYCHWLAATIARARGWPLIVAERERGCGAWIPLHTAVRTPDELALDVNGLHTDAELLARYDYDRSRRTRLRETTVDSLGGSLVTTGIIDVAEAGGHWWSLDTTDRPHWLIAAYADTLLRQHRLGGITAPEPAVTACAPR